MTWTIVIPVKPTASAKTRIQVPEPERSELVRALAADTIAAARRVADVIVVTADPAIAGLALGLGAVVETEPEPAGLNAAVARGIARVDPGRYRAALLGDLPSLVPEDLRDALARAESVDGGVVADRDGTGSTMVTASPGRSWASAFGTGSYARHLGLGLVDLGIDPNSTLRRDVDTLDDLADASRLGVGSDTARWLAGRAEPTEPSIRRAAEFGTRPREQSR